MATERHPSIIVRRTPVLGLVRLFQNGQVVSWNVWSWTARATARSLLRALHGNAPDLDPTVAHRLLALAIHWLAPARAGATLVVHGEPVDGSLDTSGTSTPPGTHAHEPVPLPTLTTLQH